MNLKSVLLPALGGILIGASVFALAQSVEKTSPAQTAPAALIPMSAPDMRFPANARWEVKTMDWGIYWANGGKDSKKAWSEWDKDLAAYLEQGYEPFSAGVYNGSAFVNQWYIFLRRLRPAEELLGKKDAKPTGAGIVVPPAKP